MIARYKRYRFPGLVALLATTLLATEWVSDAQRAPRRQNEDARIQAERESLRPRGPRGERLEIDLGRLAEQCDVPGFDLRAYSQWFLDLQRQFPRQLTSEDERDLVRMGARLNNDFDRLADSRMNRESAWAEWILSVLGLVDYMSIDCNNISSKQERLSAQTTISNGKCFCTL